MLKRGFKARAERLADHLRARIGVVGAAPVDPRAVAAALGVRVLAADELVERRALVDLQGIQAGAFSACTFMLPGDRRVIIFNPLCSPARTNSDLSHELAHIVLDHKLSLIQRVEDFTFVTCDPEQEEEANWLGGALLLSREAMLSEARLGRTIQQVASGYQVSEHMARFRLHATGVEKQARREAAQRRAAGR